MDDTVILPIPTSRWRRRRGGRASLEWVRVEPVKRVRTVDIVSQRLLTAIARGEFSPGEKLAPERELAAMLQVSRNVLREAVRQLETMGVIVVRQGDGTYVVDPAAAANGVSPAKSPLEALAVASANVLDLIEARQAIEVMSASLAAQRATLEEQRTLSRLVEEMGEVESDSSEFAARDLEFHRTVVQASRNSVLMRVFEAVRDMFKVQLRTALDVPGVSESSLEYHQRIASAIIARDPRLAANEMEGHLSSVTHLLLTQLARTGGTAGGAFTPTEWK